MTTRAARGRPRKFDTGVVLDEAVELFWDKGYRATTTRDLERALGITQSSLYNAFGSKQDLLLQAIDRYEQRISQELFVVLEGNPDGYAALDEFFEELGAWVMRNDHRGCLVVNLMASEYEDTVIVDRVQAYRAKIRDGLTGALSRVPDLDQAQIQHRAEFLLAAVLGLHITARTALAADEVSGIVAAIRHQIAGWSSEGGH